MTIGLSFVGILHWLVMIFSIVRSQIVSPAVSWNADNFAWFVLGRGFLMIREPVEKPYGIFPAIDFRRNSFVTSIFGRNVEGLDLESGSLEQ